MPRSKIVHSIETIPLDLIDRNPDQPRIRFSDPKLRKLSTSILDNGMAQLLSVKSHPITAGRYMIVTGERRWRALLHAGFREHQVIVLSGELGSAYDLSVVENLHRVDLDVIEEAEVMKRYLDQGRTMAEVMQVTGYSDFTINRRLELLELHPDVQTMIIEGKLTPIKALRLHKTPLADQIQRAHLLISGTSLDFDEEELRKDRRARKVRSSVEHPSDALLSRVMQFGWKAKSSLGHMGMLLEMLPADFAALLKKISGPSRQTLETRLIELAAVSLKLAGQLEAVRLGKISLSGSETAPTAEGDKPSSPEFAKPKSARSPIPFNGHLPSQNFGINRAGKARAEECRSVLGYLFCNPERHGRVNLSRSRLKSVLALASDRNPDDLVLGVLRVAWASWDMNPMSLQPGAQRQFLERIVHLRKVFGNNFPDAMNVAWLEDASTDPVDLVKLVEEKAAAA